MTKNRKFLIRLTEEEDAAIENALNEINLNKKYKDLTNKSELVRQLIKSGLEKLNEYKK